MTRASVVRNGQQDRPGNDLLQESPSRSGNLDGQEGTDSAKFEQEDGLESIKQIFDDRNDLILSNSNLEPTGTILNLQEVAALCRTSLRTIQEAARKGQLPARKIGHTWRCRQDEILDWLRGPQRTSSLTKVTPVSQARQVPNKILPSWDWSNRERNLGIELDNDDELKYCRKHGKVSEFSSRKGGTR